MKNEKQVLLQEGLNFIQVNKEFRLYSDGLEPDEYIYWDDNKGFCYEDGCVIGGTFEQTLDRLLSYKWPLQSKFYIRQPDNKSETVYILTEVHDMGNYIDAYGETAGEKETIQGIYFSQEEANQKKAELEREIDEEDDIYYRVTPGICSRMYKRQDMPEKTVTTNIGKIPFEDYCEIIALQYGFSSYEEMKEEGYIVD